MQQNKKLFNTSTNLYTDEFLAQFAKRIRSELSGILNSSVDSMVVIVSEILVWVIILLLFDFIIQKVFGLLINILIKSSNLKWTPQLHKHKVFRTLTHFFTVNLLISINPFVFQRHPAIDRLVEKSIGLLIISLFVLFLFRVVDAVLETNEKDEESYTKVGIRTFAQLIKIIAVFFGALAFVATLINVSFTQIFTILGALMAIILLVFRDSILGFISGIQLAISESIKIGDWISVSKYKLEGVIKEINLTVTKIEQFDKTLSTIPTYDLVSTEVTNYSRMSSTNTRRIKRAIVFNVNSFKFCDEEMLQKFEKIDLISDYINQKREEIKIANKNLKNTDLIVNGKQLTNIGTFRIYAQNYLENRDDVSKADTLTVRQLQQTSTGMPLEIYCFSNNSDFMVFEKIQSDIFDHLITASREFGLEVAQPFVIKGEDD